ncbi:hypothetical protein MTP99_005249 [Tenebrio molitor]|jgi:hypothetical protein|nr:hypothetical protein MTP99_005249 [Tenebrio molitor]
MEWISLTHRGRSPNYTMRRCTTNATTDARGRTDAGLDAVPESRLKECLQKGWVTDRMSPTDESERLFGVERGVKANFVLQKISTEDFRAECSFSERNSSDLARVQHGDRIE